MTARKEVVEVYAGPIMRSSEAHDVGLTGFVIDTVVRLLGWVAPYLEAHEEALKSKAPRKR